MIKTHNLYIYFFLLTTLLACSPAVKTPSIAVIPTVTTISQQSTISSVVDRANAVMSPVQTPTPTPTSVVRGKNTVSGAIFFVKNNEEHPYAGAILYLAETIVDSKGNESFIAMDRINSPRTIADANGKFVFVDVPEGNYGLVLDTIRDSYFLHYPETNDPILVSVHNNSSVDLGELVFDNLPINVK